MLSDLALWKAADTSQLESAVGAGLALPMALHRLVVEPSRQFFSPFGPWQVTHEPRVCTDPRHFQYRVREEKESGRDL